MIVAVTVQPRRKPLVPCVGCGTYIAKYSDVDKGHVYADDERGFVCVLCRKTVCAGCLYHSDMISSLYFKYRNQNRKLLQDYQLLSVRAQREARDPVSAYVCIRCVAEYEMKLIRKIGYPDLPLYISHQWLTRAATKYYQGVLEGRYECPSPNTPVKT